jgi:gamma-glutamyltranspeptidase / glutathione hydrolase
MKSNEKASAKLRLVLVWVVVCFTIVIGRGEAQQSAIASAHPLATQAGLSVLERGGNAFDAAIAVAAALAVVEPYSSGLGGGGFFLLHRAADARSIMIDARETAPMGVRTSDYLDARGAPLRAASVRGGTAAAIPGVPAGLAHLARRHGRLPLSATLAPAVRLARDGFPVDGRYARMASLRETFLRTGVNTRVFLNGERAPEQGFVLRQTDLADTLERLARFGRMGFYEGAVAAALVETVNSAGGRWSRDDLAKYEVIEREPVRFRYRGATVTAASLPSAGGLALAQTLGMIERRSFERTGNPQSDHARYLADPDFVGVPVPKLISPAYIAGLAAGIDSNRATQSSTLDEAPPERAESGNTTHFSVVDAEGNRVAATLTINLLFGAGIVARGTGVLLNNEMDDFSIREDVPNAFMLRGGAANRIEPGKRPLSSMTPTFVQDEKGVLILGAPGGSRIVSQVLLAILAYVGSKDVDLAQLVSMPRYHHQHWPDRIEIEPQGFTEEWITTMSARGHRVIPANRQWGNMQAVFKSARGGAAQAASDPRGFGLAWY